MPIIGAQGLPCGTPDGMMGGTLNIPYIKACSCVYVYSLSENNAQMTARLRRTVHVNESIPKKVPRCAMLRFLRAALCHTSFPPSCVLSGMLIFWKLFVLTTLVSYCATCFTCRLAGSLTFSTATFFHSIL